MNENKYFPFSYSHQWIFTALKMMEKYFGLFVGISAFTLVTSVCVGLVPYLGPIVVQGLAFLYALGTLRFMQKLDKEKKGNFDQFLNLVFDANTLQVFQKHILICLGVGVVFMLCKVFHIPYFYIIQILSSAVVNLIAMSAFFMMNKPETSLQDASDFIMDKVFANAFTLLIHYVLLMIFGALAIALCVVPFFLYYLPMTLPLIYLVYRTMCEGKTLEDVTCDWNEPTTQVIFSEPTEPPPSV